MKYFLSPFNLLTIRICAYVLCHNTHISRTLSHIFVIFYQGLQNAKEISDYISEAKCRAGKRKEKDKEKELEGENKLILNT